MMNTAEGYALIFDVRQTGSGPPAVAESD